MPGVRIPHVFGDPSLPPDAEIAMRRKMVMAVLRAAMTEVDSPTVFSIDD